jgi:glycosyltransferase involved in cell wall biosynthesis
VRRILHVVGCLNHGGTESWLLNVLRNIDRNSLHFSFCTLGASVGAYDQQITSLGAAILPCQRGVNLLSFATKFRGILSQGQFDIVHSHVHFFSGMIMWLAARAGVPKRIVHAHTAAPEYTSSLLHRVYGRVMQRAVTRYATDGLAVSEEAGRALFGSSWRVDTRWHKLYCGIDVGRFRRPIDRTSMKSQFGFGPNDQIVGHVGRFVTAKNHDFLLDIAQALLREHKEIKLLLVGDGPLRHATQERVDALGLRDRVVFAGSRLDVPELLRTAIDVLCMPSRFEGLPLTVLECQAAGLPAVLSDVISREVTILPGLLNWCSLSAPAKEWAALVVHAKKRGRIPEWQSTAAVACSQFCIGQSVKTLMEFYERGRN